MSNNFQQNSELVERALGGRVGRVRHGQGIHCPAQVTMEEGCTDYVFSYGRDCMWRLTMVNTYGNQSFVHGEGCDASGFIVNQDTAEFLDGLFA